MRPQTKMNSLVESLINIAIGFVVAIISQMIIFPCFGIYVSTAEHFEITAWFTVISIIRSYAIRRIFNKRQQLPR